MMKKRIALISILSLVVIFVATIISIGISYALGDNAGNIAYLYNTTALVPEISTAISGTNITTSDTSNTNVLKLSKYDLFVVADKNPFSSLTPNKSYKDSDNNYHLVFENLDSTTQKTLVNDTNATISYTKAIINKCSYEENDETKYITYLNRYVSNEDDLRIINFGRGFNASIDVYNDNIAYSKNVFVINDMTISSSVNLNIPCSIDLMNYTLTIDGSLTIKHNYGGSFYIRGTIVNTENLSIVAPKARLYLYGTLESENDASIISSSDTYSNILTDALDYMEYVIPSAICDDTINLYTDYMMFSVKYSYEFSVNDGAYLSLTNGNYLRTILARTSDTKSIKVRVTATAGETSDNRIINTKVYGTSSNSLVEHLNDVISSLSSNTSKVEHINLLEVLKDVGSFYTINPTINFELNDGYYQDAYFNVNNNFDSTINNIAVIKNNNSYLIGETTLTSLNVHKGLINLNTVSKLGISISSTSLVSDINFVDSSKEEIEAYFKGHTNSVLTDSSYSTFNVRSSSLYLGDTKYSSSSFDISNISMGVEVEGTSYPLSDYFDTNMDENDTYIESVTLKGEVQSLNDGFLVYTFTFSDTTSFSYKVAIAKVSSGNAGEEATFKSSNPFDDVFSQTDTNWLKGTQFDFNKLNNYPSSYYASIQIVSIDGTSYDGGAINRSETENGVAYNYDISKIVSITGDSNDTKVVQGNNVYRTLDVNVDINYVPARDVKVVVKCIAYDDTEVSVEQDYIVTIPGILKCVGDTYANDSKTPYIFSDMNFYKMTLALFDEIDNHLVEPLVNTYIAPSEGVDGYYYILSDAMEYRGELDYSTLSNYSVGEGLDLTGLENLESITSVNLTGYKVSSLANMIYATKTSLSTLILNDCSLTDAKLFLNNSSSSYLYGINLTSVDLSNNNITRTDELVYRTVTNLNLSNQVNLTSVDGLDSLIYLEELDISNNKIYRFDCLKYMNSLTQLYCFNNITTSASDFYGSEGHINLPVYIWMIKTNNVKVFAYEANNNDNSNYLKISDESGTNNISYDVADACTSLNSFVVPLDIYNNSELGLRLPQEGETSVSYKRVGRPAVAGIDETNVDQYYYFDGYDYVQGSSETFSSTTVYYQEISQTYDYSIQYSRLNYAYTTSPSRLIKANFTEGSYFIASTSNPVKVSYILVYIDSNGDPLAYREFQITLYDSTTL